VVMLWAKADASCLRTKPGKYLFSCIIIFLYLLGRFIVY